jgi:type IV secretory pathway TraG/TraD family ATPase VirD4
VRLGTHAPGSLLVVGPTQSGKTTSLCAPLVAGWSGPVFAASVKGDLCELTSKSRAARGAVSIVAPGTTGSASWDPVAGARTLGLARGLARDLTVGTGAGGGAGDQEFWAILSAKLLAPLLLSANLAGGSISTVKRWVDRRDVDEPLDYLADEPEAADALVASFSRDDRTLGSVLATVEAAIETLDASSLVVDPIALVAGANTCYLSAPLHDQRRYRPAFSGLLRQVLAAAATHAEEGRRSGLLVLLDEAASIAPIEELDQIAATCQGQGVTLVTVWQDFAQLTARYGARARTLVNNHTSRVVLGGLADPTLSEWLPALTGPSSPSGPHSEAHVTVEELRQWPMGAALLVVGRHRPVRLVLRPPRYGPKDRRGRAR